MNSKPPGPPCGMEVEATFCPLIEVEQGVALSPYWPVEQSLKLCGIFLWHSMGQRSGQSHVGCAGGESDKSWLQR